MPNSPLRQVYQPTVAYDDERSSSSRQASLDEEELAMILKRKRKWYARAIHWEPPHHVQMPLTCLSICLSAVQANGVFVWPTYGPVVSKLLDLNPAQSQTIVVGGILGVYICAAPLGALTDRLGSRAGSLMSAFLSALGYLSFAALVRSSTPDTPYIHLWLTVAFFCVGAATVGAYFASLTCASLTFPSHPTLSLSVPLSLMGLSSLVLSSFSTLSTFISPNHELRVTKFLTFLGILCPCVNIFCAVFMKILPPPSHLRLPETPSAIDTDDDGPLASNVTERTNLISEPGSITALIDHRPATRWTTMDLLRDFGGFWVFGILIALCIGPSETIMASIGSILTSLLPRPSSDSASLPDLSTALYSATALFTTATTSLEDNALVLRNKHVWILSVTSTIARLLVGVAADYLAPPPVAIPAPPSPDPDAPKVVYIQKKKILVTRSAIMSGCAMVLAGIFAWSAGSMKSERGLWVLSAGVGLLYGALFTLSPAIISAHFGANNFGLAWGLTSYFAAIGAVGFSYLYAIISTVHDEDSTGAAFEPKSPDPPICYGTQCYAPMLWVSTAAAIISSIGLYLMGKRWKV